MADLTLTTVFAQIADASTAQTVRIPVTPGTSGQLMQVRTVLGGAVSGANDVLLLQKNGTAIAGSTVTIAYSGSAAGDLDYANLAHLNVYVKEGDYISIVNGGESTDAATLGVSIDIKM